MALMCSQTLSGQAAGELMCTMSGYSINDCTSSQLKSEAGCASSKLAPLSQYSDDCAYAF